MDMALEEAELAAKCGEVPVGAVVVGPDKAILARTGNRIVELHDPTAHAEMLALRAAAKATGSERLIDCDFYVTLEPCPMCAGAISLARIRRLYYGAEDEKAGGVDHGPRVFSHATCHHVPEVYSGIRGQAAAELLTVFFRDRRQSKT